MSAFAPESSPLLALGWPVDRVAEGVEALARHAGFARPELDEPIDDLPRGDLHRWLRVVGERLGVAVEPVSIEYADAGLLARRGGPALLEAHGVLLLLAGRRRGAPVLLGPDRRLHRVTADELTRVLRTPLTAREGPRIASLLEDAGVPAARRDRAAERLLAATQTGVVLSAGWLLRPAPDLPFGRALARRGVVRRLALLLGAHAAHYLLFLGSWFLVGRAALDGTLSTGWLLAWALLLATLIPLQMLTTWLQGDLALRAGAQLKRRLLDGALRRDPDTTRAEGAGTALGRVLESETVEAIALGGGIAAATALLELPIAAWVLAQGAAPWPLLAAFALVLALVAVVGTGLVRAGLRLVDLRLEITHGLVEKMVGHRTRLAQEAPSRRHEGEEASLDAYREGLRIFDRRVADLLLVPRVWLVLGLLALAPTLVAGGAPGAVAVAIGGLLLVEQALGTLTRSLHNLTDAAVAWRRVRPLFEAGGQPIDPGLPALDAALDRASHAASAGEPAPTLLEASELAYAYPGRERTVLRAVDLTVRDGDRLLVEGPSGGGKSTLAAVLAGLRTPSAGLLRLRGLDAASIGHDAWRRRVVVVPQFHENHVVTETFAFNLLLGRTWPPTDDDIERAYAVCDELGLGPLLERMPGGLQQVVGDTGWQLSHGERSRLFLARALLQDPDLLLLDESFGALDPETLQVAMRCALRRARTLLVIAHP
ncbi:MAG: ABC transporter ATP-binding protein [Acidobacteriota bacterium]